VEAARREVERSGKLHLLVGPRCRKSLLFAPAHPSKPDPGIGLDLGYTSWKKDALCCWWSIRMISLSLWRFCSGSLEGGTGRGLLQRNSRRCRARLTVSRLTTRARSRNNCSTTTEQLQRERNQPCSAGECSSTNASIRLRAPPHPKALFLDLASCDRKRMPALHAIGNARRLCKQWCVSRKGRERSG
jgi:hypothetical protein